MLPLCGLRSCGIVCPTEIWLAKAIIMTQQFFNLSIPNSIYHNSVPLNTDFELREANT